MKKLISEKTVEKAFAAGKMQIEVELDAIVTAQAISVAEQRGVEIIRNTAQHISYADRQKIINAVLQRFPGGKFSRSKIEMAVRDVLNNM